MNKDKEQKSIREAEQVQKDENQLIPAADLESDQ